MHIIWHVYTGKLYRKVRTWMGDTSNKSHINGWIFFFIFSYHNQLWFQTGCVSNITKLASLLTTTR